MYYKLIVLFSVGPAAPWVEKRNSRSDSGIRGEPHYLRFVVFTIYHLLVNKDYPNRLI